MPLPQSPVTSPLRRNSLTFIFGIPVLVFLGALVYGGITGRVRTSSCCSVADPSKDLRMRGAFDDGEATGVKE